MKSIVVILALVFAAVLPVSAQWVSGDKRVVDEPDRKAVKGFGGHLAVIKNPREFIQEWLKPEPPNIKTAKEVKRGEQIGVFVFFAGCKQDAQGICNSEVDYTIYKPDGSVHAERKAQPLWKEQAPPARNIQMGRAILAFAMRPADPTGVYKVVAKVSDISADVSFELETKFTLK